MDINLRDIKVVVSEIDGILTNGRMPTDELGTILFKEYYYKDLEAINEIKKYIKFVFLAKDQSINYSFCRRKNIPFFLSRTTKEVALVADILHRYEATVDNVIYLGCSLSDERAMALSKYSFCPLDSPATIKSVATGILPAMGGSGVLCSFFETVVKTNLNTL